MWPKQSAKVKARAAMQRLPDTVRPYYHAEYRISFGEDDGEFAGLVCNVCNRWREYGHENGCSARRHEPNYRWRPKIIKAIGRRRIAV